MYDTLDLIQRLKLKNLKNDFGARSLIRKKDIITVKTGFGTIFDIDTKEELAKTKENIN